MGIQLLKSPFVDENNEDLISIPQLEAVKNFYLSTPFYVPTRLVSLDAYSKQTGIAKMLVKDESTRFSDQLKSFKATGSMYAMARVIAKKAGLDVDHLTYDQLQTDAARKVAQQLTFYTATDGNHGRGVAWAAQQLGAHAVVKMPAGSSQVRADHIKQFDADVEITDKNYDQTVQLAKTLADQDEHGVLMQDYAWGDYVTIPHDIALGYSIIASELLNSFDQDVEPTHLFLQAGVGQFAAGMIQAVRRKLRETKIIIVEPATVACYFASVKAGDGQLHSIQGSPQTIMAGLNCQTPSANAWPIIKDNAAYYGTLTDDLDEMGMWQLANPFGHDSKIVAGESGAAGFAFVNALLQDSQYAEQRRELGLDENSRVMAINTESDTDEESYQKIVNGK
jgi:diaminopropionate ammonia-lyase